METLDEAIKAAKEALAPGEEPQFQWLLDWAVALVDEGIVRLDTCTWQGSTRSFAPRLSSQGRGLATIWSDAAPHFTLYRSSLMKRAPNSLPRIEEELAPFDMGEGRYNPYVSDELLHAVSDAYREAAQNASK